MHSLRSQAFEPLRRDAFGRGPTLGSTTAQDELARLLRALQISRVEEERFDRLQSLHAHVGDGSKLFACLLKQSSRQSSDS